MTTDPEFERQQNNGMPTVSTGCITGRGEKTLPPAPMDAGSSSSDSRPAEKGMELSNDDILPWKRAVGDALPPVTSTRFPLRRRPLCTKAQR